MEKLLLIALIGAFLLYTEPIQASTPCGADWEPFSDEYCYKIIHKLATFNEAAGNCTAIGGSMLRIRKQSEQSFLVNFLFVKSGIVDTVWLGGRYSSSEPQRYLWNDTSELKMTNWGPESPKNLSNYCIEMKAEVGLVGKWDDEPCEKSNLIVCQKRPTFTVADLADILLTVQEELAETKEELSVTKQELAETKRNLGNGNQDSLPIGFTYVQLPKDRSPVEIWPSFTWTDVSSEYPGLFFRVQGGGSARFGQIQEENGPFIEEIRLNRNGSTWDHLITLSKTGWSDGIRIGYETSISRNLSQEFLSFKRPYISEVRPKNMAMRVWRRTA